LTVQQGGGSLVFTGTVSEPALVDRTNELYSGHAILRDGSA
jgi:hypothetical protein